MANAKRSIDWFDVRELRAEIERLQQAYAGYCVHMVRLGIPSFGTLDEAIDKMAERAEAALATSRRDALEEAARLCESLVVDETWQFDNALKYAAKQIRALAKEMERG